MKSQVRQQKTWNHSQCSGKLLLRQKLQFILLLSYSFMISFSQGSHESGESRLLVLKEEKYGSYFYQQAKQCIKNTLSFCIPAEYKLRSSCLVSVPHSRTETKEQLLLLHCLIIPCSAPVLLHCNARGKYPRTSLMSNFEEMGHREKGPKNSQDKVKSVTRTAIDAFLLKTLKRHFQAAFVCYLCHFKSSYWIVC